MGYLVLPVPIPRVHLKPDQSSRSSIPSKSSCRKSHIFYVIYPYMGKREHYSVVASLTYFYIWMREYYL